MNLPRALDLRKFREYEPNGFLHSLVGIFLDALAADLHVACGHPENQCTSLRLLLQRSL